jgi:histidinol-phosphate aminotransferase
LHHDADKVWSGLLERSVLIRNCASWDGLHGCLRVTIGRPDENHRFLTALEECLQ